ncbi:MAG: radical SAM protein [Rhizobacter sp.]|nr:radical SAM protein [Rhizobacter sp.]
MHIESKILLVDLNNFSRYPTLSIGYLTAVLRKASNQVSVFAPLMLGVHGTAREARPHRFSLSVAKLNYLAASSKLAWVRTLRDRMSRRRLSGITAHHREVVEGFAVHLALAKPHVVMISTYLMYRSVCEQICILCKAAGIPVLIGGPYFVQPEIIAEWVDMPGLSALVVGEVELDLASIVQTVVSGGDVSQHTGVFISGTLLKPKGRVAAPLKELDAVPFPDYSDFPWKAYPNRIVPVITGRGCGWGVCTFCSDVTSTAGRTYRSRSAANVLSELTSHHRQHRISRFVFTDMKLNSNVAMWRSLIGGIQGAAPGSEWIGAVHVGMESDNGLSSEDLRAAAKSGCRRLTTGLESGSQRVSDLMKKGTRLNAISAFLQDSASAGISTRCTMILGFPGETAHDVHASADFLAKHASEIERVSLNRLQVITGTTLHRELKRAPAKFKGFSIVHEDNAMAQVEHRNETIGTASHRKGVMRLLAEVHRINSRELSPSAREFEGVM